MSAFPVVGSVPVGIKLPLPFRLIYGPVADVIFEMNGITPDQLVALENHCVDAASRRYVQNYRSELLRKERAERLLCSDLPGSLTRSGKTDREKSRKRLRKVG